jgi:hypothetical protein
MDLNPGLNRVGRNPTNDFRVPDASVSSFHCELEVSEDCVQVKDLCSTNGTYIDGQPVVAGTIAPGQILQIGSIQFQLALEPVPIAIPQLTVEAPPRPSTMPDGAPACLYHPDVYARFECQQCSHTFCEGCVRFMPRISGGALAFCPSCNGTCITASGSPGHSSQKRKSFLGRLNETFRLPWK